MSEKRKIFILGKGHLAFQVALRLRERNVEAISLSSHEFDKRQEGVFESALGRYRRILEANDISLAQAIYIVDEEDAKNIELALAAISLNDNVPIFVALFNEDIAPHLRIAHKNLIIKNPALIAAPHFADALDIPLSREPVNSAVKVSAEPKNFHDKGLYAFIAGFFILWVGAAIFFKYSENLSWLDAFYFTTTVVTTTGFGDISLLHSAPLAKLAGILTMAAAVIFASISFSLIVDRLIRRRSEIELGRRKYRLRDHIILCGLGRVGYQLAEEFLRRGKEVLVIETNQDNRFLDIVRSHGAKVFIGDATLPKNLERAEVRYAAGLFSVMNNDLRNLEIGLNGRSLRPDLRVVLRIFDKDIASELKTRLNIHLALSTSNIAADEFVKVDLEKRT